MAHIPNFAEEMTGGRTGALDGPGADVEAAPVTGNVIAGVLRCKNADGESVPPTTAAMCGKPYGVSLLLTNKPSYLIDDVEYQYSVGEVADHVTSGFILAACVDGVDPEDTVYAVFDSGVDFANGQPGSLRKDSGGTLTLPTITIESAADSAYTAYVDGQPFSYDEGDVGTIASKQAGLAAAINADARYTATPIDDATDDLITVEYASGVGYPELFAAAADVALLTVAQVVDTGAFAAPVPGAVFDNPSSGGNVRLKVNFPR